MFENERLHIVKGGDPIKGNYVLYWMQQAQRTRYNHALEWALSAANACQLPLVVAVVLTESYPEANARHYAFMLEGWSDVSHALHQRGIGFRVCRGNPPDVIVPLALQAALLVGDVGYLRIQRQWRNQVAAEVPCPFTVVETDVVVPIQQASRKEEYAARTLRPAILRLRDRYLKPVRTEAVRVPPLPEDAAPVSIPACSSLSVDRSVAPSDIFRGGQEAAQSTLETFIHGALARYADKRNDPSLGVVSHMSPYLHFGQISPIDIALRIRESQAPDEAKEAYLEELIVRRELSMNYVFYQPGYDTYAALPSWARKTLDLHRDDPRETLYSYDQFDQATTHDPYWNAAQQEMRITGKMHNYMRMYWGKKIIEWSASPEEAFKTMLALNNRYEIDGRDANGFTGVAWCFGKHDRPWKERAIFGSVRYMAASGLERKFAIQNYVHQVEALERNAGVSASRVSKKPSPKGG